jgi:hypothetical protein
MSADDSVLIKALVQQIIVGKNGIKIEFKCGAIIEQKYVE